MFSACSVGSQRTNSKTNSIEGDETVGCLHSRLIGIPPQCVCRHRRRLWVSSSRRRIRAPLPIGEQTVSSTEGHEGLFGMCPSHERIRGLSHMLPILSHRLFAVPPPAYLHRRQPLEWTEMCPWVDCTWREIVLDWSSLDFTEISSR